MDQITKNTLSTVEPMLRRLGDKSIETSVQINKLTNTLKSETKENEKPSKKKKKEAIEATGAASAGAYSAPLFSQSEPEKSPEAAKVKVVKEELISTLRIEINELTQKLINLQNELESRSLALTNSNDKIGLYNWKKNKNLFHHLVRAIYFFDKNSNS